MNAVDVAK